jgi:uncharacterized protein (TIGR00730 family)
MSKKSISSVKAYNNVDFLNSKDARVLRILAEYLEPLDRFRRHKVKDTIVFFGSARTREPAPARRDLREARAALRDARRPSAALRESVASAERQMKMSRYYRDAQELAYRLTKWSKSLKGTSHRFLVCSGGGPGIMEAANRGAAQAKGQTVGLGISLPMEPASNPYISRDLAFEFHYFFMRKFWFFYPAKAMVVFPGGFGTLDECMEILTLIQTRKSSKKIPFLLYGKSYWSEVLNFDAMVRWGTISPQDLELFRFVDTPEEAFQYLRDRLTESHLKPGAGRGRGA